LWIIRQRPQPSDPDSMLYDINNLEILPDGEEWPERAEHKRWRHGDKSIGTVLDQDAQNLPGVQAGMHSKGFTGLWIGAQELRIRHFHKVLDDYLYGAQGKPAGAL
ncbi:MAG: SRPBCC family protein, partial [Steroidobacteraceae bacterium]